MMERKAYTAFGETGFGETGRHHVIYQHLENTRVSDSYTIG